MKKFTRALSLLLCFIMIFSSVPAMSISAEEEDHKVIVASDLFYAHASGSKLTVSLESDDDSDYVHFVADPGTYDNNGLVVTVTHEEITALDYPYIVVYYRTDSQSAKVDVNMVSSKGENWVKSPVDQTNNKTWQKLYINLADINGAGDDKFPAADEKAVQLRLKPWGSHSKTVNSQQYYDVQYVAYFKTEADAKAFKFDPNAGYDTTVDLEFMENIPYYEADQATIDKYMNEAMTLKQEIINSPTDVKYTGTAYYVSPKGNDENDGLTPATAFKTVSRISGGSFLNEGDAVLFERGGTFRYKGVLSTKNGVTYSAYGSGAKPKLIGSIDASYPAAWIETGVENVYAYKDKFMGVETDIGQIVFDMGRAWGIKLINSLHIGTNSNGLEMIESGTPKIDGPEDLKGDLEFWHNCYNGTLYLYSKDGNPADRFSSIEIVDKGNGISGGANGVVIDNLELFGFGSHGIGYGGTPKNLTVQNCVFGFIGGSRQGSDPETKTRFGNAVEIFGACDGFIIRNCYAHNVYDCCWTVQFQGDPGENGKWFKNVEIYNNVACYSNTGLEVWMNNKGPNKDLSMGIENMNLHHNYTFYNGYGWSQQRPNKDGNIFYGDPSVTTTQYINNSVHDNVGMFASKWLNYVRYTGLEQYNFNNNVYFQHNNKLFGGVAFNPAKGEGTIGQHTYDQATMARLLSTGFEPGSTFYYVEPDYEIPQYTPEVMNFDDITEAHWAYDYVKTAVMRNYFNGTAPQTFSPDTSMTRAMLVTVLSRITDEEIKIKKAPYTDVNQGAWYTSAVDWAYSAGLIADGVTQFRPDDAATREEMADMLYRFTLNQYKTTTLTDPKLSFSDAASVTKDYAAGVAFATENGIIAGYTDGTVKPKNTATRAEVATMIKRFVNLYKSLESDYSNLSTKTDSVVFTGSELSGITATSPGDKRVINADTDYPLLRLIPQHPSSSSNYPKLMIFERLSNVNLADYPYIKVRLKVTGEATSFSMGLTKNGESGVAVAEMTPDEWCESVLCVYDMIRPGDAYDGQLNGSLYLSPWSEGAKPTYNVDTADIEYIGFFPTKSAAEAYESELQRNAVIVKFVADGTVVSELATKKGEALVYPTEAPKKAANTFKGWDVAAGTVINSDMTVNAIFEKTPGVPYASFDANTITAKASKDLTATTMEEKGLKFIRFSVNADGMSADGTRATTVFAAENFKVKEARFAKIAFRTNIASSDAVDLNIYPDSDTRIWGPKPKYTAKKNWSEMVLDLSTLKYIGGEGVESGLTNTEYFEKYFDGGIHSFMFKPYHENGLEMKAGEYLDIAGVAFFETEADAALYSFLK
ncbi:MAG: S-layer homology domain-containing protein [Clostridia bacterium]|nr:S-layer homology domain-containing protein [Clostridia bacterium]